MIARRSVVKGALASAGASAIARYGHLPAAAARGRSPLAWPPVSAETRPWTRWWWLGSAVTGEGLTVHLARYREAGLGGVELQPIYEAQGDEGDVRRYLSPAWLQALRHTVRQAGRLGLGVDLNAGSGWNMGGSWITPDLSAGRVLLGRWTLAGGERLGDPVRVAQPPHPGLVDEEKLSRPDQQPPRDALPDPPLDALVARERTSGETVDLRSFVVGDRRLDWTAPPGTWDLLGVFSGLALKRVERAGPGAKGLMNDVFSGAGIRAHLAHLTAGLGRDDRGVRASFHDSFELEATDWSRTFMADFHKLRGYDLTPWLPDLFAERPLQDTGLRVLADVRQTFSELFVARFLGPWARWSRGRGQLARNQGHGSPANLLDVNAAVDIPETEYLGAGIFDIPGLRRGVGTASPPPYLVWRMASSPAHLNGGGLVSAESITWLDEHHHGALSQTKPAIDALFSAGINHIFFHGSTYSPPEAPWPGYSFYASAEVNPTSSLWRDLSELTGYITRCQSILQDGDHGNDLLVYWPQSDLWARESAGLDVDELELTPDYKWQGTPWVYGDQTVPGAVVERIDTDGWQFDWASDRQLGAFSARKGRVRNRHSEYAAVLVPRAHVMPLETLARLRRLARDGATVVFVDDLPSTVPGLHDLDQRKQALTRAREELTSAPIRGRRGAYRVGRGTVVVVPEGPALDAALAEAGAVREPAADLGLRVLRRRRSGGWHYFLANLGNRTVSGRCELGVPAESVAVLDALRDETGVAPYRRRGRTGDVQVRLEPGESIILRTFDRRRLGGSVLRPRVPTARVPREVTGPWKLTFDSGGPSLPDTRVLPRLRSWTDLGAAEEEFSGVATYEIEVDLDARSARADHLLDLGEVRDSARVRVNGHDLGVAWSVPFRVPVGRAVLRRGRNVIEVEVANASANRVRALARAGRLTVPHFISWRSGKAPAEWVPVPSGLLGPVRLVETSGA